MSFTLLTPSLTRPLSLMLSLVLNVCLSGCQLSAPEQEVRASAVGYSFDDAPIEVAKAREELHFAESPPPPPPPPPYPSAQPAPMSPPSGARLARPKPRPKAALAQRGVARGRGYQQGNIAPKRSRRSRAVDQLTASLGDAVDEQQALGGALSSLSALSDKVKREAKREVKPEAKAEVSALEGLSIDEPEPADGLSMFGVASADVVSANHEAEEEDQEDELQEKTQEKERAAAPPEEPLARLHRSSRRVPKRDMLPPPPAQPRALTALEEHLKQPKPHPSALWSKQGYFENTYLGGDLAFESQLKQLSSSEQKALSSPGAQLKASALDSPNDEGIGLSVHMSEVSVSGPRRVLMQVALQGSERYGWRRPPLSVVVVIDPLWMRQSPLDLTDTLTPLLNALSPVDRVALLSPSLTLAELRGGEAVRDAMIRATERPQNSLSEAWGAGQWLTAQLQQAGRSLEQAAADPHRAPGAQAVLMLCAEGCIDAREALAQEAHTLNLAGVLTSVMSAPSAGAGELWRVASAGHGGAWSLNALSIEELKRVTRGELERFSRVVARLLRLSVRFPKEVALINIIGSRMLSQARAAEVKAREVAMDKRLSARLGITSDRGEDDEGVQVVIPAFYGGDRHFITFELWVEGPGEVAEVTLKYKDMVRSLNATASTAAHLSSLPLKRGLAQREVLHIAAQQQIGINLKRNAHQTHERHLLLSHLAELNPQSALLKRLLSRAPQGAALLGAALLGKGDHL